MVAFSKEKTHKDNDQRILDVFKDLEKGVYRVAVCKPIDDYAKECGFNEKSMSEIRMTLSKAFIGDLRFKINIKRFHFFYGGRERAKLTQFLRNCPWIRLAFDYTVGREANVYEIDLEQLKNHPQIKGKKTEAPVEDRGGCVGSAGGGLSNHDWTPGVDVVDRFCVWDCVSREFLVSRGEKWVKAGEKFGWSLKVLSSFDGDEHFRNFLDNICTDVSVEELAGICESSEELAELKGHLERIKNHRSFPCLLIKGRVFDVMTGIPKKLRRLLKVKHNGKLERVAEVDLHSTYTYLLLANYKSAPWEKKEIEKHLAAGTWYSHVLSLLSPELQEKYADDIKKQYQMQVMFPAKRPFKSCPIYHALLRKYPVFFGEIRTLQRDWGYSRFSDLLTSAEGALFISGILEEIHATNDLPARTLHDCIMVPESKVDVAINTLKDFARSFFHVEPGISVKIGNGDLKPKESRKATRLAALKELGEVVIKNGVAVVNNMVRVSLNNYRWCKVGTSQWFGGGLQGVKGALSAV